MDPDEEWVTLKDIDDVFNGYILWTFIAETDATWYELPGSEQEAYTNAYNILRLGCFLIWKLDAYTDPTYPMFKRWFHSLHVESDIDGFEELRTAKRKVKALLRMGYLAHGPLDVPYPLFELSPTNCKRSSSEPNNDCRQEHKFLTEATVALKSALTAHNNRNEPPNQPTQETPQDTSTSTSTNTTTNSNSFRTQLASS
jgi:hypothetical protein